MHKEVRLALKRERPIKDSFDGPWKVYFRESLEDFLRFVDVEAHDQIDWNLTPVFLDKELHLLSRKIKRSPVIVDSLVKVWLKTGEEKWILIHVEFQTQKEIGFPERIFIYNVRAYDRYKRPVASYAVLADEVGNWKPTSFSYEFGKSRTGIEFGVLKLTDYRGREQELEESDNPFALAALAQLKTVETRRNPNNRYEWKLRLSRLLLKKSWNRERITALYYFIDWMMRLPQELETQFDGVIEEDIKEDNDMELISPREKRNLVKERNEGKDEGIKEGVKEGVKEGIKEGIRVQAQLSVILTLTTRFVSIPESLESRIRRIDDIETLEQLLPKSVTADSLDSFVSYFNDEAKA